MANLFNWASRPFQKPAVHEVLPKAGLVVSEKGNLTEILCKPKILPLKSITLQKLEEMEVRGFNEWSREVDVFQLVTMHDAMPCHALAGIGSCLNAFLSAPAGQGRRAAEQQATSI